MPSVTRKKTDVADKLKLALGIDGHKTSVGWFKSARYEDGTPVAAVAASNEFGGFNKPPRPFMRPTSAKESKNWGNLVGSGARAIIKGNATPNDVMTGLGLKAEGDIRKTIATLKTPPLAQSTINARKSKLANGEKVGNLTKPLVETALMINTLSSSVEKS